MAANVLRRQPAERLTHADGVVDIEDLPNGARHVRVGQLRAGARLGQSSCETSYPVELIAATLAVKGPGSLCDELRRDEDPGYVQAFLRSAMLGYVAPEDFEGRRMLDLRVRQWQLGAGAGPDAAAHGDRRRRPRSRYVELARLRAAHHGLERLEFRVSPGPTDLPADLGTFDFVSFSAVFEHLLPAERVTLLPRVWATLRPGGVLFLNQTPHRYFPVEYHTTGLPLLNYLPDAVALRVARRLSPRVARDEPWIACCGGASGVPRRARSWRSSTTPETAARCH